MVHREVVVKFYAEQLCIKNTVLCPEIGVRWIDNNVTLAIWINRESFTKKDNLKFDHLLEFVDGSSCMDNKLCVSLGFEIA